MDYKTLLYEKSDGIGIITLNRPKILNALDDTFFKELSIVMDNIAADSEVKAIVLTGYLASRRLIWEFSQAQGELRG